MRKAVKAHATITAAFRVGRSRSMLEMRVTRALPLLLELPPPATAASPDPARLVFADPEPGGGCSGCGAAEDWTRLARAAGAARSTSSSSRRGGSSSSGAARIVRVGGSGPWQGARLSPGSAPALRPAPGDPAAEAAARCLAGNCSARKSPRRRYKHVAPNHSRDCGPRWAGQATRPGCGLRSAHPGPQSP